MHSMDAVGEALAFHLNGHDVTLWLSRGHWRCRVSRDGEPVATLNTTAGTIAMLMHFDPHPAAGDDDCDDGQTRANQPDATELARAGAAWLDGVRALAQAKPHEAESLTTAMLMGLGRAAVATGPSAAEIAAKGWEAAHGLTCDDCDDCDDYAAELRANFAAVGVLLEHAAAVAFPAMTAKMDPDDYIAELATWRKTVEPIESELRAQRKAIRTASKKLRSALQALEDASSITRAAVVDGGVQTDPLRRALRELSIHDRFTEIALAMLAKKGNGCGDKTDESVAEAARELHRRGINRTRIANLLGKKRPNIKPQELEDDQPSQCGVCAPVRRPGSLSHLFRWMVSQSAGASQATRGRVDK